MAEDPKDPPPLTAEERAMVLEPLRRKTQSLLDDPDRFALKLDATSLLSAEQELSLRTKAVAIYMSSPAEDPFLDVLQEPALMSMGEARLQEWRVLDSWDLQRKEMQRRVVEHIRVKLTDQVTEMKVRDLEDLGRVIGGAKVLLKETPPKSWEGVAKVLLAATNQRAIAMKEILERVAPKQSEQLSLMEHGAALVEKRGIEPESLRDAAARMLAEELDDEAEEDEG